MKSDLPRGSSVSQSRTRRALVQPRFLVAAMTIAVGGVSYLATAQTGRAPVAMTSLSGGSSGSKPVSLQDLPGMVEAYGQARYQAATAKTKLPAGTQAIGTGQSGYNLVEGDLTPTTKSDEIEPVYSPNGNYIAFVSNGVDVGKDGKMDDALNAEGKYHVWVMNRDGSVARQISGLYSADKTRNQSHPSWSPDGNQLVYVNGEGLDSELYVSKPFINGTTPDTTPPFPERRTFYNVGVDPTDPQNGPKRGALRSPAWAPSGLAIVFASQGNLDGAGVAGQYDLFRIDPDGGNVRRLTGGTTDPTGNNTDDYNPNFASVNQNVFFFSSNRDGKTVLQTGRRIWRNNTNGTNLLQVTDPTKRGGTTNDIDDYPTLSLGTTGEQVAFQSNSPVSSTDTAPNGARDYNIWSFSVNSVEPDPPTVASEPRVVASNFSGNTLVLANPTIDPLLGGRPSAAYSVLTGVNNPEGVQLRNGYIFASSRGNNQIVRYDEETGDPAPAAGLTGVNFTPVGSVPEPSGLYHDGQYLYVAAGSAKSTDTVAATAVYRFNATTGAAAPNAQKGTTGAVFSFGENPDKGSTEKVTGGAEGITADPTGQFLLVSFFGDNQINVYRKASGQFIKTIVPKGEGGLNGPTGLTFGPDLNGDGFRDIYVNSSNGDAVLAFRGPNPNNFNSKVGPTLSEDAGTFIVSVVAQDPEGTLGNLNAPEGIQIVERNNAADIFVSSFHSAGTTGGAPGTGNRISRYTLDLTAINPADPTTQVAKANPRNTQASAADGTFITFPNGQGIGYFDFNGLAVEKIKANGAANTPVPPPGPVVPEESNGEAKVVTSIISSPENYNQSGLNEPGTNVLQDRANDEQPAFSRIASTPQLAARLVFASTRRYAPSPSSNVKNTNGQFLPASNPYGFNEGSGVQGTHDIWGTSTRDVTPPALIPQAAGNLQYPVVSPHADAPFFAPRTRNEGLDPGNDLKLSFVLSDQESGLDLGVASGAITATFYKAGTELFSGYSRDTPASISKVNESVKVVLGPELKPRPVVGFQNLPLTAYDDGPPRKVGNVTVGHERQGGAVAGDGNYYCTSDYQANPIKTPTAAGDYYIDISVRDQAGNSFVYDNVWGFSTTVFQPTESNDLFVSDYTAGQIFPSKLVGNNGTDDDGRFVNMDPVESYWLSNPGGQAIDDAGKILDISIPETFDPNRVDIWRTLCRGPVPQGFIDAYAPNSSTQLDPNEKSAGEDGPFTKPQRKVTVANRSIIWGAPYAGTTFSGPGTIDDADMQARLKLFLNVGGRLFVSGRDVAWALTNGGTASNSFLKGELGADFAGEVATNNIDEAAGGGGFNNGLERFGPDFRNLQVPYRPDPQDIAHYNDAALTMDPTRSVVVRGSGSQAVGIKMDTLTAQGDTTPAYTVGGQLVGQRLQKERTNGLQSRVVFFGFGLEGINRRYRMKTNDHPEYATNTRRVVAQNILQYFKTGVMSGTVINADTNLPIPNFLLKVTGGGSVYLVRTIADGTFTLDGLPPGGYRVEAAFILGDKLSTAGTPGAVTSPSGYTATVRENVPISGGSTTTGVNLRPVPESPGSIRGTVVTSKGTPTDFSDDAEPTFKIYDLPILLRSVNPTSLVDGGGYYVRITRTNSRGEYAFDTVPANTPMTIIYNPTLEDIPEGSEVTEADGRPYSARGPQIKLGRRIIPDNRRSSTIVVPPGDTFVINDPDPAKYPNPDAGPGATSADNDKIEDSGFPIVIPEGPTIRGVVTLNGVIAPGATVELLDSKGQSLVPPRVNTTLDDGSYSFGDVTGDTTYIVRGTATTADGVKASKDVTVTPKLGPNGEVIDSTVNIPIMLYKITGKVTLNGAPAGAGVVVQLLNNDGTPFAPRRQVTTNAQGEYTIDIVPNGSYKVRGIQGQTSGTVSVIVNDKDAVAPEIKLINQSLTGVVSLRVDGGAAKDLEGARVELLASTGQPLTPAASTVTDKNGNYSFSNVSTGKYLVRASYNGDTQSAPATVTGPATTGPSFVLALQNLPVKVIDSNKKVVSSATLQLIQNNMVVQMGLTNGSGVFTFKLLPAGTYTISATKGVLSGQADVTVKRLTKMAQVTVQILGDSTGATNPTTFNVKGKIYLFSMPYEDSGSPESSNVSERIGNVSPATIKVKNAFTVPPVDSNGDRNYLLQRWDTTIFDYVDVDPNGTLVRGQGYLLQVLKKGTALALPDVRPANKPLTASGNEKYFIEVLHLNPSVRGNPDNGRNLIGFGLNPGKYKSVDWSKIKVIHPNGEVAESLTEAVNKGWLKSQITTLDSSGATTKTVNVTTLKPYGGYFVQTKVDGLQVILRNPKQ